MFCDKISMKIPSAAPEIWAKLWENVPAYIISRIVKEFGKKYFWNFLDQNSEADDFQKFNLFFFVQRYISGRIFMKMRSVIDWLIDIRLILKAVSTRLYNINDDEDK